nr:unnamed protein product [Digitaria exilis]
MVPQLAAAAAAFITGILALARLANCNTEGDILYAQMMAWQDPLNVFKSWNPILDNPCPWEHVVCDSENYGLGESRYNRTSASTTGRIEEASVPEVVWEQIDWVYTTIVGQSDESCN